MTTLALLGVVYVTALALILAILAAAKLGDEDLARQLSDLDGAPDTLPTGGATRAPGRAATTDAAVAWRFTHAPSAGTDDEAMSARDTAATRHVSG